MEPNRFTESGLFLCCRCKSLEFFHFISVVVVVGGVFSSMILKPSVMCACVCFCVILFDAFIV